MKLLVVLLLILILCQCYEGYINYLDVSYEGSERNCPQMHANNFSKIRKSPQTIQPFGYTKNEYLDMTRFVATDVPLPTNPDFFY